LKNEAAKLAHGAGSFVLGGIDDLILGKPDWPRVMSKFGAPHILLSHNPDHFYDAARRGVSLVLSGHTHGGQIRLPLGPPIIRQSRFCLDEGAYSFESSLLVVTRGLGSILLPWRWGADPEAVMIDVVAAK
ncbi:MAG TPA: metallophosphoesterase, partial [Candidatus Binatia bacterium]